MNTITTISKEAPADISMDYERLRLEGIQHLEELATHIWTDFNAHDPGITILEVLCYAITDLGYRANLPIEDLLAEENGGKKSFFAANEILPICPVTPKDYQKLLIDIPEVRNAWVERADDAKILLYCKKEKVNRPIDRLGVNNWIIEELQKIPNEAISTLITKIETDTPPLSLKEVLLLRNIAESLEDEDLKIALNQTIYKIEAYIDYYDFSNCYWESKFRPATESAIRGFQQKYSLKEENLVQQLGLLLTVQEDGASNFDLANFLNEIDKLFENALEEAKKGIELLKEILCTYRFFEIKKFVKDGTTAYTAEEIAAIESELGETYEKCNPNGLSKVCIDTYEPIEPDSKVAKRLIERIKNGAGGLNENRNLGEDFQEFHIVPPQNICLCLDIIVKAEAEEAEVMANALFRLQQYLTPSVPFFTLQQMLEKGYSCDEIFNGPLLNNGFIEDSALDAAIIPNYIRLSDLYKIILETEGVDTVNTLRIKNEGETSFRVDWCYDYRETDGFCPPKAVIDVACSILNVTKNGIEQTIYEQDVKGFLELLALDERNLAGSANNIPAIPNGIYRSDLSDYQSIQFEFPDTYVVGDNNLAASASSLRKGQVKQLKAFLLFFDRFLADYLMQLSKVKDLLSVCQDAEMPTYFYQSLIEVPGVPDLITTTTFQLTTAVLDTLAIDATKVSQLRGLSNEEFLDENSLLEKIEAIDNLNLTEAEKDHILEQVTTKQHFKQLEEIIETSDDQFNRKHQLLDHLLARFGEQFSGYVATIFESREAHLEAKTAYLKALPELGLQKAKGYNARAIHPERGNADVWNTENVAALKQRIYGLLGLGPASTQSVLANPVYRLIEEEDRRKDLPHKHITFFEVDENNKPETALLKSTKSYSSRKLKQLMPPLYVLINNEEQFRIIPQKRKGQFKVVFEATIPLKKGEEDLILASIAMSEAEANALLRHIVGLISAKIKGGFHLLEHILLRPNDEQDELLQMTFSCDLNFCPVDPYSFWLSAIIPAWKGIYSDPQLRNYFKQVFLKETPSHIAVCFRWVEEEDVMEKLEFALEQWQEALANCTPDECEITDRANDLIKLLNQLPCDCFCSPSSNPTPKCTKPVAVELV